MGLEWDGYHLGHRYSKSTFGANKQTDNWKKGEWGSNLKKNWHKLIKQPNSRHPKIEPFMENIYKGPLYQPKENCQAFPYLRWESWIHGYWCKISHQKGTKGYSKFFWAICKKNRTSHSPKFMPRKKPLDQAWQDGDKAGCGNSLISWELLCVAFAAPVI